MAEGTAIEEIVVEETLIKQWKMKKVVRGSEARLFTWSYI